MLVGLALVTGVWGEFINWLRATVGPGQVGL
jgi:cytochrome c-type biogenesis protein